MDVQNANIHFIAVDMVEICTDTSKCYVVTETRKFASNGGEVKI
jgi:hypothetical protein